MTNFLLFADAHYTTKPETGDRLHPLSAGKLQNALETERGSFDFIVNLGDTTDAAPGYLPQTACFSRMTDIMASSGKPFFSLIGNHDTATDKQTAAALCGMPGRYFSFDAGDCICLFLDTSSNAISDPYPAGLIDWERCVIDAEQLAWLQSSLNRADKPVLVFGHACFALKAGESEACHLIRNREPVMHMFEQSGKVAAVFCGHYHPGDMEIVKGIPYITLAAMCVGQDNAYALVSLSRNTVTVQGRGRQLSYCIKR